MSNRHDKYLSRVDLVKNQVERQRLKEQEYSADKRKKLQQQNKLLYERQQLIASAELAARVAASNASGGDESSTDTDAQAFITAASITNPTQQSAINQLVVDLKGYGIWTKMKAVYPFVGGTASSHKFNLKNPLDTDAAFRLVFNGGWTHNSNGIISNGSNAFADTRLNSNSVFGSNYAHQSVYLRNNTNNIIINGHEALSNLNRFDFGFDSGKMPFHAIGNTVSTTGTDTRTDGFTISYRTGFSTGKLKRNNIDKIITIPNFTAYSSINNYILGARAFVSGIQLYNIQELAFASLGDGLTDTEVANFYTSVQAFQTTLNRQV